MNENFMFLPVSMMKQQTAVDIKKCNDFTSKYGLVLTDQEIQTLVEHRKETLERNGRIEFRGGIIQKIIMTFADSSYIYQDNYLETLLELQDCFYYFKNESLEEMTDDELINLMKEYFDGECQGSIEYLESTVLENICKDVRYGREEYRSQGGYEDDYRDFFEEDYEE